MILSSKIEEVLEKVSQVKGTVSTKGMQSAWLALEFNWRLEWLGFTEWGKWEKLCFKIYLGGIIYRWEGCFHPSTFLSSLDFVIQISLLQITYIILPLRSCLHYFYYIFSFLLKAFAYTVLLLNCGFLEESFLDAAK